MDMDSNIFFLYSAEEGSNIQVPLFESQLGAFNASSQRKLRQRRHLLSNIGPCRRALCARRDVMIRKQLGKVDKVRDRVLKHWS